MDDTANEPPIDLRAWMELVKELRWKMLCDVDDDDIGLFSKPHFFLALAALESAQQHLDLAATWRARELAGNA